MKYQMNFTTSYDDTIRFQLCGGATCIFIKSMAATGLEAYAASVILRAEAPDIYLSPKECPLICAGDGDRDPLLLQSGTG